MATLASPGGSARWARRPVGHLGSVALTDPPPPWIQRDVSPNPMHRPVDPQDRVVVATRPDDPAGSPAPQIDLPGRRRLEPSQDGAYGTGGQGRRGGRSRPGLGDPEQRMEVIRHHHIRIQPHIGAMHWDLGPGSTHDPTPFVQLHAHRGHPPEQVAVPVCQRRDEICARRAIVVTRTTTRSTGKCGWHSERWRAHGLLPSPIARKRRPIKRTKGRPKGRPHTASRPTRPPTPATASVAASPSSAGPTRHTVGRPPAPPRHPGWRGRYRRWGSRSCRAPW